MGIWTCARALYRKWVLWATGMTLLWQRVLLDTSMVCTRSRLKPLDDSSWRIGQPLNRNNSSLSQLPDIIDPRPTIGQMHMKLRGCTVICCRLGLTVGPVGTYYNLITTVVSALTHCTRYTCISHKCQTQIHRFTFLTHFIKLFYIQTWMP